MAAKTDWSDGQSVTAASMNALGTEVNGKQPLDADLTALAALSDPAGKLAGIAAGATVNSPDATLLASAASAAAAANKSADTITDGSTNKAYTATEKTKLAAITGTNTGDQTTITGNAGTATKLQTARTINGVSFDGTANITITDSTKESTANKGAANGYAPLDASQLVPAVNLPSYVDDVLEYTNLAGFPGTGTSGKIYVALDTGKIYRWSGSAYVEISPSPGSTDSVTEGSSNLYYTNTRADARITAAVGTTVQAYSANLTDLSAKTAPSGALVGSTGAQTLQSKTLTNPTINNYTEGVVAIGNTSTAKTIDLTSGTVQTATLTGNCTFTMPTVGAGKSFVLYLKTGAGSFTATFTSVKWPAAGAPTITVAASKMDILTFVSDGTNWYGTYVLGYTP